MVSAEQVKLIHSFLLLIGNLYRIIITASRIRMQPLLFVSAISHNLNLWHMNRFIFERQAISHQSMLKVSYFCQNQSFPQ